MNQSSTEVSRTMYLTYSSLLYHFIECSTCCSQVSYLLQLNLLPNIKSKKLPSAFSSSKKSLFIGVFGWRHSWMQKCITLPSLGDESIYPAWWAYRSITVSIYTYHGEYIALLSSLKKLNALKALPPVYSLFSQGMFFFRLQPLSPSAKAFANKTETAETGL